MEPAQIIRDAVARVGGIRQECGADPSLAHSVHAIKSFQARRFAGSYSDLLADDRYSDAARFFLEELYSDKDYTDRDTQFGRIAGGLQALFTQHAVATAVALAQLHVLTEELDLAMARAWRDAALSATPTASERYAQAWRVVGRRGDRNRQLQTVLQIGRDLAGLTRLPGLRLILRMMRKPAHAAGLGSLQDFLEAGFDTFASMTRHPQGVDIFLATIEQREAGLIDTLFDASAVACATKLDEILGQLR